MRSKTSHRSLDRKTPAGVAGLSLRPLLLLALLP
jgi:hypothetical protein